MEATKLAKDMLDFYKMSFDNTYNSFLLIQEQMEKMLNMQLDQTAGFPEEGKKVITDWVKAYKKGCDDFKSAVDESFKRAESYFASLAKSQAKK
ncbi:MAG: hypothetical protein ACE14T_01905 [Syntrophales bacterium]